MWGRVCWQFPHIGFVPYAISRTHICLYIMPIKDTIYIGINVLIVSVRNDESIFSVCQPVIFIRVLEHCCIIIIIIFYARLHIVLLS